jgi:hypothetical protein
MNMPFFNVDGIPVSVGERAPGVKAWDTDPPRDFPPGSVQRNGWEISEADFDALVKRVRASRQAAS